LRRPKSLRHPDARDARGSTPQHQRRIFDRAAASVGLAGLTPHDLRHAAASLAVAEGANVKAVQRMLGHASAAITLDVYADLFEDDLDQVADRLDRAVAGSGADSVRTEGAVPPLDMVSTDRRLYG
jgi:integrase